MSGTPKRLKASQLVALIAVASLPLTACGADDNAADTKNSSQKASETASSSSSAKEKSTQSDNPKVTKAVAEYSTYVNKQADDMVTLTKTFTDAVRAGDLKAAQAAYAPSREPWERIEPIAGLIEELDGVMDSRVENFKNVDDPEFTGWHRLEYILFNQKTTDGAKEFADKLDKDVATLHKELKTLEIPAADVPVGASELVEEVSNGKITGEEDRYSKTDLWDLAANIDGAKAAVDLLMPALTEEDPDLAKKVNAAFTEMDAALKPLKAGDGWKLYCIEGDEYPSDRCNGQDTLDKDTVDKLKTTSAALSEETSKIAGALGLK